MSDLDAAIRLARGDGADRFAAENFRAGVARLTRTATSLDDPASPDHYLALLRLLYSIGRQDLPLGRLIEGHFDALQIVARYGTAEQVAYAHAGARAGRALGVWNADLPGEPLRLDEARLSGAKSFASGAGLLTDALVTADAPGGRQLLLLDLAETMPAVDTGWWRTTGMQRSETHIVRWHEAAIPPAALVGSPGDYAREPWFSGGALRFVAVQAGGVAALFDRTRDHLLATGRADDPHQLVRLARLFALADGVAATVARTAARWFEEPDETRLARVAAARMVVYDAAEEALGLAQAAVGLQGAFEAHPLAAMVADLSVYIRQPGPDAQRMRVGRAAAVALTPAL